MKTFKHLFKNQQGMTGLETAIILIAFVTVAAVFGYAVLGAGLFSAEQGKSTIYAGLNEAQTNLELSGSVVAKSDDSVNVKSILFTVKNAIAGKPIDMNPNDGTGHNKCVISLKTNNDYLNNVKWSFVPIGADNGNNLLETGEQFEVTVDLTDLGSSGSLSENLTANQTFTLQVKPAIGSTITIQRQLPPAIGPIMDLDLMNAYGGGGVSTGSTGGSSGTDPALDTGSGVIAYSSDGVVYSIGFRIDNPSGGQPIDMASDYIQGHHTTVVTITTPEAGTLSNPDWFADGMDGNSCDTMGPGTWCSFFVYTPSSPALQANDTFTITITPQGGSTLTVTKTLPAVIPPTGAHNLTCH